MADNFGDVIWDYYWDDGACLKLYDTPNYYKLVEYDTEGKPVAYSIQNGYSLDWYDESNYPKDQFTYDQVIADIEEEYDLL